MIAFLSARVRSRGRTSQAAKRLHTVAGIAQAVGVHRTTVYGYLSKGG